jgi:KDO2-lipid IV(A) lauroyltransferase
MNWLLHLPVAATIAILQSLPLTLVAMLGRFAGHVVWWVDWKRRRIALVNLDIAFGGEMDREARHVIARENFRRLGEAFFCAMKTSVMRPEELKSRLQAVGLNKIQPWIDDSSVPGIVIAVGHFGNIEMYGETASHLPWVQPLMIIRPTGWKMVDHILADVRAASTTSFFDETTQMKQLRETIRDGNVVLGLRCDCPAGEDGMSVPFFGKPVSTSVAPVVHSQRFGMPLFSAACFRTGIGRWRVEISDQIPTRVDGRPRAAEQILAELNQSLETAVRRDPANWCWVQPRWEHAGKAPKRKGRTTDGE